MLQSPFCQNKHMCVCAHFPEEKYLGDQIPKLFTIFNSGLGGPGVEGGMANFLLSIPFQHVTFFSPQQACHSHIIKNQ